MRRATMAMISAIASEGLCGASAISAKLPERIPHHLHQREDAVQADRVREAHVPGRRIDVVMMAAVAHLGRPPPP